MANTDLQNTIVEAESSTKTEFAASTIGSRYVLGDRLGRGGMAVVYEAEDTLLSRLVAVKVLRPDQAGNPEMVRLFLNEAKILGQLEHAGVVPVHDSGELADGRPFYAMKRVVGDTLEDVLKRRPENFLGCPHNTAHLVDIFESVCQTVAYAHARGIIHRDLKPANIMIGEFASVLVMDWGLSKEIESPADIYSTQPGAVRGTPAYMSPEQATGKTDSIDYRSDVFALGVILYEILTGKSPFSGKNLHEILSSVVYHEPDNPRRVIRCLNRDLSAICQKALQKDPLKRYPSATELARDLRSYLEHREVSARRQGILASGVKWARRHPTLTGILATASLLLVCWGSARGYHLQQQQRIDEHALRQVATLERQVASLDDQIEAASRENPAAPGLVRKRFILHERTKMILAGVIGRSMPEPKPEALSKLRRILVAEAASLLEKGAYLEADYMLSELLDRCDGEDILDWSEEDADTLASLKDRCHNEHGAYQRANVKDSDGLGQD